MDDATAKEILDRLERLESKVDAMLTFTVTLQNLAGAWMSGGRGKLITTLAKMKGSG